MSDALGSLAGLSDDALMLVMKAMGRRGAQGGSGPVQQPAPPVLGPQITGAKMASALFELAYVPAFIKAANARGRYFKDLADLGTDLDAALKTAQLKIMPPRIPSGAKIRGGFTVAHPTNHDEFKSLLKSLKKKPLPDVGVKQALETIVGEKLAARIVNADCGLNEIIGHMKSKKKKTVDMAADHLGASGSGPC